MSKKQKNKVVVQQEEYILDKNSPFVMREDYRTLALNLGFAVIKDGCKVIAVTSANRGEGKSTTSLNLAITLGMAGNKVILIDGDLRLPSIAKKLQIPTGSGLTELVVGKCGIKESVKKLGDRPIFVLTSGTVPPDPTRLLSSDRMKEALEAIKAFFDYIIIDLPPINVVSDALVLADQVDGYITVVRNNSTEYKDVTEMIRRLEFANCNVVGTVLTHLPARTKSYGKYGKYGRYGNYGNYGK